MADSRAEMVTRRRPKRQALVAALAASAAVLGTAVMTTPQVAASTAAPAISVSGNHIVDANGNIVQLRGVNRSGAEYACAEGWGIWDGPTDDDTSIGYMLTWKINTVRIPLNEDCWLGINGVKAAYSGANYINAVVDYVNRLNAHGIIAMPNLHFSAPGTTVPDGQFPMADRDHSDAFWTSVASTFKTNHSVLFDLFNEPYPDNNQDTTAAWTCVRDGGTCSGVSFTAAGMQEMVDAVRATGATQPLLIGGPQYAGDVDHWTQYKPTDPANQLVASIHIYGLPLDSPCRLQSCWDGTMAPLATTTPIVIGEFGDTDCTSNFSPPLMTWADAHGVSYTAWAWNASGCGSGPSLITDYTGTPTAYGVGVRDHLLSVSPSPSPSPSVHTGRRAAPQSPHLPVVRQRQAAPSVTRSCCPAQRAPSPAQAVTPSPAQAVTVRATTAPSGVVIQEAMWQITRALLRLL